ncbi:TetR/AcrR family transcriptional regulator [Nonomuraea sp. NPDC049695]|uniref:TetR/AcrR family transcriptional regulator n=1 Tax=Nonomuraea sp. NPDC049695 TaxID=3154734 RepID=UPI00341CE449
MRSSQRERLIEAMLQLVARRGYAATTVPDVIAAARVSRNAFYQQFADKEGCFLALCERDLPELIEEIRTAAASPDDWRVANLRGLRAYLRWWQERPAYAQAYFVELPRAGERAVAQRDRAYHPFIDMVTAMAARARKADPALPPLSATTARLIVYGVTAFVEAEVREGRVAGLLSWAEDLHDYMVTLLTARPTVRSRTKWVL